MLLLWAPLQRWSLQALAPMVVEFPLEDEHLLVFNNAVQCFEWLQMLVLMC